MISHRPPAFLYAKSDGRDLPMEQIEKEMSQLKHRLEEAQARDRVKERKARTRRLIQEGAILEKALPQVQRMTLEQLEVFLCEVFKPIR